MISRFVKDLLTSLVILGLDTDRPKMYVITPLSSSSASESNNEPS